MSTRYIQGVGELLERKDFWEGELSRLDGGTLSIDSKTISSEQEARARWICENWPAVLSDCRKFIEAKREKYGLRAKQFDDPGVFMREGDEWTVWFGTESESEAIVGVEFRGDKPFQLVIGD